jgi:C-terminal processing protease CtpA/Prc
LLPQPGSFTLKFDSSGTGPSDHTSFYRKDIPVLFFFTGLHTDYHKPSDDADRINYNGMVKIVRYIERIIDNSSAAEKLVFTRTREQNMGTGRFKVSIGIMPDYTFSGTGVKADGVIDGRPAKAAGLQANDVILQLGEHLITGVDTYMQALNRFEKGQTTKIVFKRGETVMESEITF